MSSFEKYSKPILPSGTGLTVLYIFFIAVVIYFSTTAVGKEIIIPLALLGVPALMYAFTFNSDFAEEYFDIDLVRINVGDSGFTQFLKRYLGSFYTVVTFPFLKYKSYLFSSQTEPDLKEFTRKNFLTYYVAPFIGFVLLVLATAAAIYFNENVINKTNSVGVLYMDPSQRKIYQLIFTLLLISIIFSLIPNKMATSINNVWHYYMIMFVSTINLVILADQINNDAYRKDILVLIELLSILMLIYSVWNLVYLSDSGKDYRILVTGNLKDEDRININGELFGVYDAVKLILKNDDKYFNNDGYFDKDKALKNGFEVAKPLLDQLDQAPKATFENQLKRLDRNFISLYLAKISWEKSIKQFFKVDTSDRNKIIDGYFSSDAFNDITKTDVDYINNSAKEFRNSWFQTRRTNELPEPSKIQKVFSSIATTIGGSVMMGAVSSSILQEIDISIDKELQVLFNRFMFCTLTTQFARLYKFFSEFNIYNPEGIETLDEETTKETEEANNKAKIGVLEEAKKELSRLSKIKVSQASDIKFEEYDEIVVSIIDEGINVPNRLQDEPEEIEFFSESNINARKDLELIIVEVLLLIEEHIENILDLLIKVTQNNIQPDDTRLKDSIINYYKAKDIIDKLLNDLYDLKDDITDFLYNIINELAKIVQKYLDNISPVVNKVATYDSQNDDFKFINNYIGTITPVELQDLKDEITDTVRKIDNIQANYTDNYSSTYTFQNAKDKYIELLKELNKFINDKLKELNPNTFSLTGASTVKNLLVNNTSSITKVIPFFTINKPFPEQQMTKDADVDNLENVFVYKWNDETEDDKLKIDPDVSQIYKKYFDDVRLEKNRRYIDLTSRQKNKISSTDKFRNIYKYYFNKKVESGQNVDDLFEKFNNIFKAYTIAIRSYLISSNPTERELTKDITLKLKDQIFLINEGFPPEITSRFEVFVREEIVKKMEIGRIVASESIENYNLVRQKSSSLKESSIKLEAEIKASDKKLAETRNKINNEKINIFNRVIDILSRGNFSTQTVKFESNTLLNINFKDAKTLGIKNSVPSYVKKSFNAMVRLILSSLSLFKGVDDFDQYKGRTNLYTYSSFISYSISKLFIKSYNDAPAGGGGNGIDRTAMENDIKPIITDNYTDYDGSEKLFRNNTNDKSSSDTTADEFYTSLGNDFGLNKTDYNDDVKEFFEISDRMINDILNEVVIKALEHVRPNNRQEYLNKIINKNDNNIVYYILTKIFADIDDKSTVNNLGKDITPSMKTFLVSILDNDYKNKLAEDGKTRDPVEILRETIIENPIVNCLGIIEY